MERSKMYLVIILVLTQLVYANETHCKVSNKWSNSCSAVHIQSPKNEKNLCLLGYVLPNSIHYIRSTNDDSRIGIEVICEYQKLSDHFWKESELFSDRNWNKISLNYDRNENAIVLNIGTKKRFYKVNVTTTNQNLDYYVLFYVYGNAMWTTDSCYFCKMNDKIQKFGQNPTQEADNGSTIALDSSIVKSISFSVITGLILLLIYASVLTACFIYKRKEAVIAHRRSLLLSNPENAISRDHEELDRIKLKHHMVYNNLIDSF